MFSRTVISAFSEATGHQSAGHFRNGGGIGGEDDEPGRGLNEGLDVGAIAAMESECIAIGQGPADAGGRQRKGREIGDYLHFGEGYEGQQLAGDAIVERIAGGEDDSAPATQGLDAVNDGGEGLRPEMALGIACRHGSEEAVRADNDLGFGEEETGVGGEAIVAVFAHADDRKPLAHVSSRVRALTTAAAMAEPPLRPRRVA